MTTIAADRFLGCVLGLALGDALGAPFEGGILERLLWRMIGRTRAGEIRWTDDTQMSIDLIESLLAKETIDPDDLAARFAASYRWTRGYGPATGKLLKRIATGADWREANHSVYPGGSFGNGAAMRAPIVGLAYASRPRELDDATRQSAIITHAHALGVEGAVLMARATAAAVRGCSSNEIFQQAADCCRQEQFKSRLVIAKAWLDSRLDVPVFDVARQLGNRIVAHESCVTSLYLALRFIDKPLLEMLQFIAAGAGDVDTIGAMAGAIWGAANGADRLPDGQLMALEQRERLATIATELHRRFAEVRA
jgi:poly(ADP-ribose) glycohydrolase ARH3